MQPGFVGYGLPPNFPPQGIALGVPPGHLGGPPPGVIPLVTNGPVTKAAPVEQPQDVIDDWKEHTDKKSGRVYYHSKVWYKLCPFD